MGLIYATVGQMLRKPAETEWAANILRLLDGNGWSQRKLAIEAGLSENQISRLINKTTNPEIKQLRKVALALGVKLWELFLPADLAGITGERLQLGTPLTPTGDRIHAQETPEFQASPDGDITADVIRAALAIPAVRAAVVGALRNVATVGLTDERASDARTAVQRAIAKSQTRPDGSAPASPPDRPDSRRSGD